MFAGTILPKRQPTLLRQYCGATTRRILATRHGGDSCAVDRIIQCGATRNASRSTCVMATTLTCLGKSALPYMSRKLVLRSPSSMHTIRTTTTRTNISWTQRRNFSVSAAEVEKFNSMHADWWNPSKNPLISMNACRMKYIRQQVVAAPLQHVGETSLHPPPKYDKNTSPNEPLGSLQALDIGCGGGLLSESLARLGAQVTGIDPSTDLLAAARHHAQHTLDPQKLLNLTYINTTAENLALSPEYKESFHVVCLLEVIEHVRDPTSLLQAASGLLRPGGLLFISTMNRTVKSHLLTITGAEYIMRLLPPGTHDWSLYRSPDEVRQLVENCGMEQVDTTGMVLARPPIMSFDWTLDPKDTDVNWIGCYAKR